MHSYDKELKAAMEAVRKAARLTSSVRDQLLFAHSIEKEDKSPVTIADFGAQALVFDHLHRIFPDLPALGEEDAQSLRDPAQSALAGQLMHFIKQINPSLSAEEVFDAIDMGKHPGGSNGRFWALDPIDGTMGFLRNDQYAIALALIENGKPVLGVLGCPALPAGGAAGFTGCLFAAAQGFPPIMEPLAPPSGSFPISVSATRTAHEAVFCESVESGHSAHSASAGIAADLGTTRKPIRMDSQCKYAAVARGDADLYLRLPTHKGYEEKIWDHAAGAFLVEAAGGTVTDIDGQPLNFSMGRTLKKNRGIVASNGNVHQAVLESIQRVGI